jgi:RNA polymerase sigma-70 factor (ECF subfamily)
MMAIEIEPTNRPASSDADLVARLKAGDTDAFEEMVRTLGGRLLAVARRMLADEEAARDAVQDAFLSAFRSLHGFDGHSQLSTWLHRIVVNAALMRIRTRQRRPEQSIDPLLPMFAEDGHHAEPVTSWAESPERLLEQREMRTLVRAAIAAMPETYRVVLVMRDVEGLSTHEAARALGVSDNALKLRLHRARQALATLLRERLTKGGTDNRRATEAAGAGTGAASFAVSVSMRAAAPARRSPSAATARTARPAAATWPDRFADAAIPLAAL